MIRSIFICLLILQVFFSLLLRIAYVLLCLLRYLYPLILVICEIYGVLMFFPIQWGVFYFSNSFFQSSEFNLHFKHFWFCFPCLWNQITAESTRANIVDCENFNLFILFTLCIWAKYAFIYHMIYVVFLNSFIFPSSSCILSLDSLK